MRNPLLVNVSPPGPDWVIRPRNSTTDSPGFPTPTPRPSAAPTRGELTPRPVAPAMPALVRTVLRVVPDDDSVMSRSLTPRSWHGVARVWAASLLRLVISQIGVHALARRGRRGRRVRCVPASQHQAVVGQGPGPELDLARGEVAPEGSNRLRSDPLGRGLVRGAQAHRPGAERAGEVGRVAAQHLEPEPRLETQDDLGEVRAERLGEEVEDGVPEGAPALDRRGVRRVVVRDGLQAEPAPRCEPGVAGGEEAAVAQDALDRPAPVAGEVLEGAEAED